ncbi:hypothetical protein SynSYN20_00224 [Synechococcus sp. SYN20]|nr:hypothetical protein SynSYN20_00224 [Synechococcus sp. SYN20]
MRTPNAFKEGLSAKAAHRIHGLAAPANRQSGQPSLIQFSDGLKFRILMQQR